MRKLALGGEHSRRPGVLSDHGPLSPPPSPKEPSGVSGLLGNGASDTSRERLRDKKEMGDKCVWPTVTFVIVICDVNTF